MIEHLGLVSFPSYERSMSEPRYRPLRRLEAGGMAEVFIAEAQSLQGFKKRVAIKRVLPHLASNQNFIGMFLDEARLGARLNHANIVTVFDIGQTDNTYFIVMEYVDGCNLKKVVEFLRRQEKTVPLPAAAYMCIEACRGLAFAHDLTDDFGEVLDIVHRDISPPNILISKRGEVKVTDFGLAKATTQLERTDPGVVKGKFSYLSPEAALGQPVDARADIFSLGVVLWEMLAGRRLFLGDAEYKTIKLVQQAEVPSIRAINPETDEAFEQLLLKALARDPRDRFQTAGEFGDALSGYLFERKLKVTSYDLARLVQTACADDPPVPESRSTQTLIDKLISEELAQFTSIETGRASLLDLEASQASTSGALPLDAEKFVDPAGWFSDDDFGDDGAGESLADELDRSSSDWPRASTPEPAPETQTAAPAQAVTAPPASAPAAATSVTPAPEAPRSEPARPAGQVSTPMSAGAGDHFAEIAAQAKKTGRLASLALVTVIVAIVVGAWFVMTQ